MAKPIDKVNLGATRLYTSSWNHLGFNPPNVTINTWTNESHGTTNDQWESRIRLKDDVTSSFWARQISVDRTDGYICSKGWVNNSKIPANLREDGKAGSISHSSFSTFPAGDSGLTRARQMASANFWDTVQSVRHSIEGGELLGELGRTAKAIKSNASSVLQLLTDWRGSWRKIRKHNRRLSKRQLLGHAGDTYLAWKFGYDPLMKDIKALATQLEEDYVEVVPITAKGFGVGATSVDTVQAGLVGCNYDIVTITKSTTKFRYDAGVLVQRYGSKGFADRLGIHPNNFLPTLYNLLPWTWMIDYFTNVGSLINGLYNIGVRYSYKSQTYVTTKEVTHVAGVNPRPASGLGWIDAPGYPIMVPSVAKWTAKYVQRTPGGPDAWPDLQFRFPLTTNVGGRWQWGNIAAVLAARTFGNTIIASYGPHG